MQIPNRRAVNLLGAIACAGMMAFALYSQHVLEMDPCPLCILQRLATIGLGIVFLLAALQNPGALGSRIYAALGAIVAAAGIAVAGWHVHLQNLPADEVPSCGPGLEYMVDNFPLKDVLGMILQGSGECAEVSWRFIGLTMPSWVVVCLVLLLGTVTWNNLRR